MSALVARIANLTGVVGLISALAGGRLVGVLAAVSTALVLGILGSAALMQATAFAQLVETFTDCRLDVERGTRENRIRARCPKAAEKPEPEPDPKPEPEPPMGPRELFASPVGRDDASGSKSEPISLAKFNQIARPGDTLILTPGKYPTAIRPDHNGTDSAWITYRATGFVYLAVEGSDLGGGGIDLENRKFIRIDGATRRYFRMVPEGNSVPELRAAVLVNLHRASDIEIIGVDGNCPTPEKSCTWLVTLGIPDQDPVGAERIAIRHSRFRGNAFKSDTASDYTEDVLIAANARHVLIEHTHITGEANHVGLNLVANSRQIVIRHSLIRNPQHTALSCYRGGEGLWLHANAIHASGHTRHPVGGPGNVVQLGCPYATVTANYLSQGAVVGSTDRTIGGIICATGADFSCIETQVLANIIDTHGPAVAVLDFANPRGQQPWGGNIFEGNLLRGSDKRGALVYWDDVRASEDVWRRNHFVGPDYSFEDALSSERPVQGVDNTAGESAEKTAMFLRKSQRMRFTYRYAAGWPEWMGL